MQCLKIRRFVPNRWAICNVEKTHLASFDVALIAVLAEKSIRAKPSYIVAVITFYLPSCLGQKTVKGPFEVRVKLPPAHLSQDEGFTR